MQSQIQVLDLEKHLPCIDIHSNRISNGAPVEVADVESAATASLHLEHPSRTNELENLLLKTSSPRSS